MSKINFLKVLNVTKNINKVLEVLNKRGCEKWYIHQNQIKLLRKLLNYDIYIMY